MIKKISAFTLVELITAVALIIVLSVISVPIYKNNTQQAKQSEGYSLLSSIRTSQYAYYREFGYFFRYNSAKKETYNDALGVDARGYKYFNSFTIANNANTTAYTVTAHNVDGSSMVLNYNVTTGSSIS